MKRLLLALMLAMGVSSHATIPVKEGCEGDAGTFTASLTAADVGVLSSSVDTNGFTGLYLFSSGTESTQITVEWSRDNVIFVSSGSLQHGHNCLQKESRYVRFRGSGRAAGSVTLETATISAAPAAPVVGTITANQGTAGSTAWPVGEVGASGDSIGNGFEIRARGESGTYGYLGMRPQLLDSGGTWWRQRGHGGVAQVSGQYPAGTVTGGLYYPHLMAGDDGGNSRSISVDGSGHLQIDVLTAPVSGTPDHGAVTVGSSATLIVAADSTRSSVTIINAFTNLVAIGNSDVTLNTVAATDGFVLATSGAANDGSGGTLTLNTTAAIYGIGASASSKVIYFTEAE